MQEVWKDVVGYEGLYQVSNLGRVKSLSRVIIQSNGHPQTIKECIMSGSCNGKGYKKIVLSNMNKKTTYIHILVAMAFLDYVPNKNVIVVDHINNDKLDNRLSNLRVISHRENISRGNRSSTNEPNIYKVRKKFRVVIANKGITYNLGYFNNIEDAIKRRNYFKQNEL